MGGGAVGEGVVQTVLHMCPYTSGQDCSFALKCYMFTLCASVKKVIIGRMSTKYICIMHPIYPGADFIRRHSRI